MSVLIGLSGRALKNGEFVGTARVGKDEVAKTLIEAGIQPQAFAFPLKRAAQVLFGLAFEETWNDSLKEVPLKDWALSPRQIFQRLGTEGGRQIFDQNLWGNIFSKRWAQLSHGAEPATSNVTPFGNVFFECAVLMMDVSERDAAQSSKQHTLLPGLPWTMDEVTSRIITGTLPAILQKPASESYEVWERIRNGRAYTKDNPTPYPVIAQPKGMVALDSRFENEASIVRSLGGTLIHIERELPDDIPVVSGHASEKGIAIQDGDIVIVNDGSLADLKDKVLHALAHIMNIQKSVAPICAGIDEMVPS